MCNNLILNFHFNLFSTQRSKGIQNWDPHGTDFCQGFFVCKRIQKYGILNITKILIKKYEN